MGCIASCSCCARANQVQLTEQQIQLRVPNDESAEDADRFKRIRQWILSIEEVPKDIQMAAMHEYLTMSFTDNDNDDANKSSSPLRKSITGTQGSLDSDGISPNSNVQTPRTNMQGGTYEMLCKGPSFEESNFKLSGEPPIHISSMRVETDRNLNSSLSMENENMVSIAREQKTTGKGSEGEISLGKSEEHGSESKEIQKAENGHYELKKQVTLPGRTVRSNSPSSRLDSKHENLKWSHS